MNTEQDLLEAIEKPARKPALWCGLDVAKDSFEASVWLPNHSIEVRQMRNLPTKSFPRTPTGVAAFFAWAEKILGGTPRVVMEATGAYSPQLAVWLLAHRPTCAPAIINPKKAKDYIASLSPRNNTDRIAARALARYGMERSPSPHEPLTPDRKALRDLLRYRVVIVEQRQAQQMRLQEGFDEPRVLRMLRDDVRSKKRQETKLTQAAIDLIKGSAELGPDIQLLRTIYGVDWIVAATVVAELGNLARFETARQCTAFAGVSACYKDSGTSVRVPGRMTKMGPPDVRRVLCMAARCAVRGDNEWADHYRHLLAQGKTKLSAEAVIMRKMLTTMWAMIVSRKAYEPHYGKAVHNS